MKTRIPLIVTCLLLIAPAALADYDRRLGAHVTQYEWARFYADTALRQVRDSRQAHCGFHGGHWSLDYYVHFNWALGNSRHKGWVVIDRRNEAMGKCRSRHGHHYGHHGRDYSHYRPDYRSWWRSYSHRKPHYGHHRGHSGHDRWRHDDRRYGDGRYRDHDRHEGYRGRDDGRRGG